EPWKVVRKGRRQYPDAAITKRTSKMKMSALWQMCGYLYGEESNSHHAL
ncbi:ZFP82 isoform 1, partial [Pongo abelii]